MNRATATQPSIRQLRKKLISLIRSETTEPCAEWCNLPAYQAACEAIAFAMGQTSRPFPSFQPLRISRPSLPDAGRTAVVWRIEKRRSWVPDCDNSANCKARYHERKPCCFSYACVPRIKIVTTKPSQQAGHGVYRDKSQSANRNGFSKFSISVFSDVFHIVYFVSSIRVKYPFIESIIPFSPQSHCTPSWNGPHA